MARSVYIAGTFGVALLGFGLGMLTGRQFPVHHFQRFDGTPLLFDNTNGKVCKALKSQAVDALGFPVVEPTNPDGARATENIFDKAFLKPQPSDYPTCGE